MDRTLSFQQDADREAELVQRNREIAKLRDQFHRSQEDVDGWKVRNDELVARLSEFDTELRTARSKAKDSEERASRAEAELRVRGCGGDVQSALARCLILEQTNAKLEGRIDEFRFQQDNLEQQLQEERQRARVAQNEVTAMRADMSQRSSNSQDEVEQLRRRAEGAETAFQDALAKQCADSRVSAATASKIAEMERLLAQERERAKSGDGLRESLVREIEELQGERNSTREEFGALRAAVASAERNVEGKARDLQAVQDMGRQLSVEAARAEERLQQQLGEAANRIVELEQDLSARPTQDLSAQADVRARILQTESQKLKTEVQTLKRQCHETHEGALMGQEEMRTRTIETQGEIIRLRMQLEETRRARSLEMRALISKMCTAPTPETRTNSQQRASMGGYPRRPSPGPGSMEATAHF